jgi:cbb3-type cytochrome c oxidase subunit III
MKRITVAVAAVLCLVASTARAEDAKALFAQKCASCHGATGKGDTAMGKKLGAHDLTALKSSEAEIAAVITNGKPPKMTPYKDKLSGEQIKALAKYVKAGVK